MASAFLYCVKFRPERLQMVFLLLLLFGGGGGGVKRLDLKPAETFVFVAFVYVALSLSRFFSIEGFFLLSLSLPFQVLFTSLTTMTRLVL